jgi:hypothetical protein
MAVGGEFTLAGRFGKNGFFGGAHITDPEFVYSKK